MSFKWVFLLLIGFPIVGHSADEANDTLSQQEIKEEEDEKVELLPISVGLQFGNSSVELLNESYLSSSEDDRDTREDGSPAALFIAYELDLSETVKTESRLSYAYDSAGGVVDRHNDYTDSSGNYIRMGKRTKSYDMAALGLEQRLFKRIRVFNVFMSPYVGVGLGVGKLDIEEYWESLRKKPILFSKHNRYNFKNKKTFTSYSLILGASFKLAERWHLYLQSEWLNYRFKDEGISYSQNGEDLELNYEEFMDNSLEDKVQLTTLGVRLQF